MLLWCCCSLGWLHDWRMQWGGPGSPASAGRACLHAPALPPHPRSSAGVQGGCHARRPRPGARRPALPARRHCAGGQLRPGRCARVRLHGTARGSLPVEPQPTGASPAPCTCQPACCPLSAPPLLASLPPASPPPSPVRLQAWRAPARWCSTAWSPPTRAAGIQRSSASCRRRCRASRRTCTAGGSPTARATSTKVGRPATKGWPGREGEGGGPTAADGRGREGGRAGRRRAGRTAAGLALLRALPTQPQPHPISPNNNNRDPQAARLHPALQPPPHAPGRRRPWLRAHQWRDGCAAGRSRRRSGCSAALPCPAQCVCSGQTQSCPRSPLLLPPSPLIKPNKMCRADEYASRQLSLSGPLLGLNGTAAALPLRYFGPEASLVEEEAAAPLAGEPRQRRGSSGPARAARAAAV